MNTVEARRRLLGRNVYKRTTEGNPAIAQGSLARMYPGITMQGWTEQAQYEGKNLLDASQISNLDTGENTPEEYTVSGNTIIAKRVDGTTNQMEIRIEATLEAGSYYCSYDGGEITTKAGEIYQLTDFMKSLIREKSSGNNLTPSGVVTVPNVYAIFTIDQESDVYWEVSAIHEWASITELKLYGMRIVREVNTPWEPYTGGQPSPSPDYPQEIVNAGKYDEASRKYQYTIKISDSEESPTKSQTVTLTSDRPLTKWDKLEKRGGQWGWVYKSEEIESYTDESVPGEYYSTTGQLSVGAQVWYETATETFVPLLESEQEAMNALYTFRPTTVLSNDCECEMTLTYKTKKSLEVTD